MTLNESQGPSKMYENVEFGALYQHTKLERNLFANLHMQANVKISFDKITLKVEFSPLNIKPNKIK